MTDATASAIPVKRRRWLRWLAKIALGLFLLVVLVYFVATSSAFFTAVILPRVGKAMNANVTVSDASISPFSQVILRNLKVQTTGPEPLLTAAEVRARYNLKDIIGGKIHVSEVALESPENSDGTNNLDPLLKLGEKGQPTTPPAPSKTPSNPLQIDVKAVVFNNATLRRVKNYKGGGRDLAEVSNLRFALNDLKNGQAGKLSLGASIKVDNNPPDPGTNGALQAKLDGDFTFGLSADLQPTGIKGQLRLSVENAGGALIGVRGLAMSLACDATPTELKDVSLRFQKDGADLGQVQASGPFDMAKSEGHLTVQVLSIDRQVLNLVGTPQGIDFGSTTISSTNQIELAKAGKMITVAGQLDVAKLSLTRTNQTTPVLDLRCVYSVAVNRATNSALLSILTLTGAQNQQPFLRGELASPMNLAWGDTNAPLPDSTFNFGVTNLNLADWKAFLGEAVSAGVANLSLKLHSQQSGTLLVFDLSSQLDGLVAKAGTNQITQAGVTFRSRGQIAEFETVNLEDYRLQLLQQNQPVLELSGSGQVDTSTQAADLQLNLSANLPGLLRMLPQPGVSVSSGTVELKSHIISQQQARTVTGNLALTDLSGQSGGNKFQSFGVKVDLDAGKKNTLVEIRKANGTLAEGTNPGGSFEASGRFDTARNAGQFALKLADLNQNALRPFLETMLGDKKLVSVSITGGANGSYDAQAASAIKADIQMAELVVNDPKGQIPATPLEARLQLDTSLDKQIVDLRQFQINLTPTARATNALLMTGKVDLSKTNGAQGALKVGSDSFDVTPYYDLLAEKPKTAPSAATAPASPAPAPQAPPPAGPQTEPPPIHLPIGDFTAEVNVGRFYLREIAITNLLAKAKLAESHVNLDPVQLGLNGAPVKASVDLDLGSPGYRYSVFLGGDKIPLEPLANTFMPDKRGLYKGDLIINTQIKGAGVTGASLQKSLAGQLNFSFTNASVQIVSNSRLKSFLSTVGIFLGTPDLADSPLNWVNVQTEMGSGRVDFKTLALMSPLFRMDTAGVMPISEVLTNSPFQNWPVNFYLARAVAERVRLVSPGTAQTGNEMKLPNFLRVAGTLGTPKAQIDKTALAGTLLEKFGNKIPGLNEKTGGLLQGFGGILSRGQPGITNTNAPAVANTNQPPATNKPSSLNLFDLLKKPKR